MDIDKLTDDITVLIRRSCKGEASCGVASTGAAGAVSPSGVGQTDGGAGVLVALSGGADSVALLRAMLALGYNVEAVHCNFHLRGEESDRDEAFCKTLCDSLGVPLHLAHFDTKAYADLHGVSIEMAARTLRYDYFFKLVDDLGLDGVCVAHHRDDSVETVLLNMVRGTGIEGLKGIVPRNGKVLRPLLGVSRKELEGYLASIRQDFIVDSSNLSDDVQRNKVRLDVVPELLKINPSSVANIQKLTRRVQDVLRLVEASVERISKDVSVTKGDELLVSIPRLLFQQGAETVLWYLLKGRGFSSAQVENVFSCLMEKEKCGKTLTGKVWETDGHVLLIDRDCLAVQPKGKGKAKSMRIPETGTYVFDEQRKLRFKVFAREASFEVSREPGRVCLDADKVAFPLVVRTVGNGDWFVPFGMKGRKLLSDFMTDKKLSLFEKQRQLVVTDSSGAIVWVVGMRPDNRFCVGEATVSILEMECV